MESVTVAQTVFRLLELCEGNPVGTEIIHDAVTLLYEAFAIINSDDVVSADVENAFILLQKYFASETIVNVELYDNLSNVLHSVLTGKSCTNDKVLFNVSEILGDINMYRKNYSIVAHYYCYCLRLIENMEKVEAANSCNKYFESPGICVFLKKKIWSKVRAVEAMLMFSCVKTVIPDQLIRFKSVEDIQAIESLLYTVENSGDALMHIGDHTSAVQCYDVALIHFSSGNKVDSDIKWEDNTSSSSSSLSTLSSPSSSSSSQSSGDIMKRIVTKREVIELDRKRDISSSNSSNSISSSSSSSYSTWNYHNISETRLSPDEIGSGYKERLKVLRHNISLKDITTQIDIILTEFNNGILQIVSDMTLDVLKLLGKPPIDFVLVSVGSVARLEACPYSDLEFGCILGSEANESHKNYFSLLCVLLDFKLVCLGEDNRVIADLKKGFCVDRNFNPLSTSSDSRTFDSFLFNKTGFYSSFQGFNEVEQIMLMEASFIYGSHLVFSEFKSNINRALDYCDYRKTLGRNLIRGHIASFSNSFAATKNLAFNAKVNLVRFPYLLIQSLCLYYGLEPQTLDNESTWVTKRRIRMLVENKKLNKDVGEIICDLVELGIQWRYKAHIYYKCEYDDVLVLINGSSEHYKCEYDDVFRTSNVLQSMSRSIEDQKRISSLEKRTLSHGVISSLWSYTSQVIKDPSKSWRQASGRKDGKEGYVFGDITRIVFGGQVHGDEISPTQAVIHTSIDDSTDVRADEIILGPSSSECNQHAAPHAAPLHGTFYEADEIDSHHWFQLKAFAPALLMRLSRVFLLSDDAFRCIDATASDAISSYYIRRATTIADAIGDSASHTNSPNMIQIATCQDGDPVLIDAHHIDSLHKDALVHVNSYFDKALDLSFARTLCEYESFLDREVLDKYSCYKAYVLREKYSLIYKRSHNSKYGRCNVRNLGSVHMKVYPQRGGVEYAASLLSHMISGYTAAVSLLKRVELSGFEGPVPVLFSKTVHGINLQVALNENPNALDEVDLKSFSWQFIRTLILNPEDDKPDNFVIMQTLQNGLKLSKLVCVDNDHAFSSCLSGGFFVTLLVKSIIYCSNHMSLMIHEDVARALMQINPEHLVKEWLDRINSQDLLYRKMFPENEWIQHTSGGASTIPITLEETLGKVLYYKLRRLKAFLVSNPLATHWMILNAVEPTLGHAYKCVTKAVHLTPEMRFNMIAHNSYRIDNNVRSTANLSPAVLKSALGKIPSLHEIRSREKFSPKQMAEKLLEEIPEDWDAMAVRIRHELTMSRPKAYLDLPNDQLREEIISGILLPDGTFQLGLEFEYLDFACQKLILALMLHKKAYKRVIHLGMCPPQEFIRLNLHGCRALTDKKLLQLIKNSPHLSSLVITNCENLTSAVVKMIMSSHPNLSIYHSFKNIPVDGDVMRALRNATRSQPTWESGTSAMNTAMILTALTSTVYEEKVAGMFAVLLKERIQFSKDFIDNVWTMMAGIIIFRDGMESSEQETMLQNGALIVLGDLAFREVAPARRVNEFAHLFVIGLKCRHGFVRKVVTKGVLALIDTAFAKSHEADEPLRVSTSIFLVKYEDSLEFLSNTHVDLLSSCISEEDVEGGEAAYTVFLSRLLRFNYSVTNRMYDDLISGWRRETFTKATLQYKLARLQIIRGCFKNGLMDISSASLSNIIVTLAVAFTDNTADADRVQFVTMKTCKYLKSRVRPRNKLAKNYSNNDPKPHSTSKSNSNPIHKSRGGEGDISGVDRLCQLIIDNIDTHSDFLVFTALLVFNVQLLTVEFVEFAAPLLIVGAMSHVSPSISQSLSKSPTQPASPSASFAFTSLSSSPSSSSVPRSLLSMRVTSMQLPPLVRSSSSSGSQLVQDACLRGLSGLVQNISPDVFSCVIGSDVLTALIMHGNRMDPAIVDGVEASLRKGYLTSLSNITAMVNMWSQYAKDTSLSTNFLQCLDLKNSQLSFARTFASATALTSIHESNQVMEELLVMIRHYALQGNADVIRVKALSLLCMNPTFQVIASTHVHTHTPSNNAIGASLHSPRHDSKSGSTGTGRMRGGDVGHSISKEIHSNDVDTVIPSSTDLAKVLAKLTSNMFDDDDEETKLSGILLMGDWVKSCPTFPEETLELLTRLLLATMFVGSKSVHLEGLLAIKRMIKGDSFPPNCISKTLESINTILVNSNSTIKQEALSVVFTILNSDNSDLVAALHDRHFTDKHLLPLIEYVIHHASIVYVNSAAIATTHLISLLVLAKLALTGLCPISCSAKVKKTLKTSLTDVEDLYISDSDLSLIQQAILVLDKDETSGHSLLFDDDTFNSRFNVESERDLVYMDYRDCNEYDDDDVDADEGDDDNFELEMRADRVPTDAVTPFDDTFSELLDIGPIP